MTDPILIIGAGGFVGTRLTQALVARGERVIALCRHVPVTPDAGVEVHVGTNGGPSDYLPLLQRSRAVVHVASASTPGSSAAKPLLELDENLRPALALLQALQQFPATPLVYVSSGGTLYDLKSGDYADEAAMVVPRSYHGAGKIAAEHFIAAWCSQFGSAATILRPSNLYGPGQTERAEFGIIPTAFGKALRRETLHVWGDGSAERDYLYIDDFTRLVLAALDAMPMPGFRIFNACSSTSIDLNGLLGIIERISGRTLHRTYDAGRKVDAPSVRMQATRARQAFGWNAEVKLAEGLERTWRWFSTTRH